MPREMADRTRRFMLVRNPDLAVDRLVARVRGQVDDARDAQAIRAAFAAVLADLRVKRGDPAWTDGRDVIGAAYERLLRGSDRRSLGQYFTPLSIGRAMAAWLFADQPHLLLDPACGSGSLLAAAAHERAGDTKLVGFDVDPLAIAMAQANGDLRRVDALALQNKNFLIDEIDDRPDAVICNPPFTRNQELSHDEKAAIHQGFNERLGLDISRLASLHVLFLVRALEISADDARLAFITPAHWLDMNYGRTVKEFLLERARVEAIVQFPARQLVFEHAVTTAAITVFRKGNYADTARTRFAFSPSTSREDILSALGSGNPAALVQLSSHEKWSRATRTSRAKKGKMLADLATVRRGAATGCNEFFVLSDQARRFHKLNHCYLRPCAASPRWFEGNEITEETLDALSDTAPRWLLSPTRARLGGPLERYLERAESLGVHERHLVTLRVKAGWPWWAVEADFAAPILFTYLNRSRPRFVRNRANAIPLNNWLAIDPLLGVDADELFASLQKRTATLRSDAREYGNGLWKLEPSELKRLTLPDL